MIYKVPSHNNLCATDGIRWMWAINIDRDNYKRHYISIPKEMLLRFKIYYDL